MRIHLMKLHTVQFFSVQVKFEVIKMNFTWCKQRKIRSFFVAKNKLYSSYVLHKNPCTRFKFVYNFRVTHAHDASSFENHCFFFSLRVHGQPVVLKNIWHQAKYRAGFHAYHTLFLRKITWFSRTWRKTSRRAFYCFSYEYSSQSLKDERKQFSNNFCKLFSINNKVENFLPSV